MSLLEEFENRTREESAVVYGLFSVLCPMLDKDREKFVCAKIDAIFTHTVLRSSTQTDAECVAEAVREQLSAESLQPNMDLVSKASLLGTHYDIISLETRVSMEMQIRGSQWSIAVDNASLDYMFWGWKRKSCSANHCHNALPIRLLPVLFYPF